MKDTSAASAAGACLNLSETSLSQQEPVKQPLFRKTLWTEISYETE